MNTELTEKLEQLEANLRTDDYGDSNYVMELLKEAQNLAINFTHCCTELKTVKQGEKLILDNKFDVEVVTPESSVLIKHKDKDRLIWVDKQRLKRK